MIGHILAMLGITDQTSAWYAFWSGLGSDMSEIGGLLALAWIFWRKHNCHVKGCWRIGHLAAGAYLVCRKHHPAGEPSSADVARAAGA